MTKRHKLNPNRFTPSGQKLDDKGLFSFDPIRRDLFKWGMLAGAVGGFLMLRPEMLLQIAGVFLIVFIANFQINKAADTMPRWQATVISLAGAMLAIVLIVVIGVLINAFLRAGGGA